MIPNDPQFVEFIAVTSMNLKGRRRSVFNQRPKIKIYVSRWRRGSESSGVFTDYQPQYPDLQGDFNADFTRVQAVFNTIRQLSDLTRHLHAFYSVIEEIVEGFVEGFLIGLEPFADVSSDYFSVPIWSDNMFYSTLTLWRAETVETTGIIRPLRIAKIGRAASEYIGSHRRPDGIC